MNKYRTLTYLISVTALISLIIIGGCGEEEINRPPEVVEGITVPTFITANEVIELRIVSVNDPDGDPVTYTWSAQRGEVEPTGPTKDPVVSYTAPAIPGDDTVTVIVSDGRGGTTSDTIKFTVVTGDITPPSEISVMITGLTDGDSVPWEIAVKGTSSGIPTDYTIWVCVFPPNMRYYPQPGPAAKLSGGGWQNAAFIGKEPPEDVGKYFIIFVVVADELADKELRDYIEACEKAGNWPGMESLPSGAIIYDQIEVIRE